MEHFDFEVFLTALAIGFSLLGMRGIEAINEGFGSQRKMRRRGFHEGYSLFQQGSTWVDIFVINPGVAYFLATYNFAWTAWWTWLILAGVILFTLRMGKEYNEIGLRHPVADSYQGRTAPAGWIHAIFAIPSMWIIVMVYLTPLDPLLSTRDLLITSAMLPFFFFFGMYCFSERWDWVPGAKRQLILCSAGTIILAVIKWRFHIFLQ